MASSFQLWLLLSCLNIIYLVTLFTLYFTWDLSDVYFFSKNRPREPTLEVVAEWLMKQAVDVTMRYFCCRCFGMLVVKWFRWIFKLSVSSTELLSRVHSYVVSGLCVGTDCVFYLQTAGLFDSVLFRCPSIHSFSWNSAVRYYYK